MYLMYLMTHFVTGKRCLGDVIDGIAQLVAVKADEWRRKALKVMGQTNPKLEVVRELFHEGRALGFEDRGKRFVCCSCAYTHTYASRHLSVPFLR